MLINLLIIIIIILINQQVHDKFEFKEETLFLTVNLLDRFLEKQAVAKEILQLVGLVALLLAGKYEETFAPLVHELVFISYNTYTRKDVLQMVQSSQLNDFYFIWYLNLFLINFTAGKIDAQHTAIYYVTSNSICFMRRFLKADKKVRAHPY